VSDVSSEAGALPIGDGRLPAEGAANARGNVAHFHKIWPWAAAVLSGVLLALAYPPVDRGGLIWFALTPLVAAVWVGRSRWPFLLGYVAALVFFTVTFWWIGVLGKLFGAVALRGIPLLLAAYLALYPAAWTWLLARVLVREDGERLFPNSWRNLATGIFAASAWTALEWVRGWLFSGFGWNGLGVALHRDLPMIQVAEFTGVLGLTWLVAYVNVMAVIIVRRIIGELGPRFLARIRWEFSITMALILGVFAYGTRTLFSWKQPLMRTANIGVIQPNIPQEQKFDPAAEDAIYDQLEKYSILAAALKPDLIVWPESVAPRGIFADEEIWNRVQAIQQEVGITILTGTVMDEGRGDGTFDSFNSAFVLGPHRGGPYHKMHLVPFGEYLPMRAVLGWMLSGLVPGDFDSGSEHVVFDLPTVGKLSAVICFEDTLGDQTRRFVQNGAQVLVNITNDGWFMDTCGMDVHLANAIFRAVENRRPLVRCANTGITCLVQPTGHIDPWLAPHTEGFATKPVPVPSSLPTFYTRHGDWFAWLSTAVTALALLRARMRKPAH
jgi:apolipoprotein N-acyltransferase